jgi:hypothetical protein
VAAKVAQVMGEQAKYTLNKGHGARWRLVPQK